MGVRYKNLIFTNHALQRMRERGLSEGDVWATWKNPDKSRFAKSRDGWVYNKKYNSKQIEVVAKKNEKGEWLVISAWSKPVFGSHKISHKFKLNIKFISQLILLAILYILYLLFVSRILTQTSCLNTLSSKIYEFQNCNLSSPTNKFLLSELLGFALLSVFYYFLSKKWLKLILTSLLLIIILIVAYYAFLYLNAPKVTSASVYLDTVK